eukprot:SAG31_NODE_1561_length_7872_cov_2.787469_5_plen_64_part_00
MLRTSIIFHSKTTAGPDHGRQANLNRLPCDDGVLQDYRTPVNLRGTGSLSFAVKLNSVPDVEQ